MRNTRAHSWQAKKVCPWILTGAFPLCESCGHTNDGVFQKETSGTYGRKKNGLSNSNVEIVNKRSQKAINQFYEVVIRAIKNLH